MLQKLLAFLKSEKNSLQGVMLPTIGLVQIKTCEGKIYLFRTGTNVINVRKPVFCVKLVHFILC